MATWDRWFPDVLPHVPGAPPAVVRHELRRSAQTLLARARAWQVMLPAIPVPANTSELAVAPSTPANQRIVRIEAAWLDGVKLDPLTPDELDASGRTNWENDTGTPSGFLQLTPGVVTLYPKPIAAASQGLRIRVSLCPADRATTIPDDVADRFSDEIQIGARGRLMLYPNKPWSNPQLGATYLQSFNTLVDSASARVARSMVGGRIASRPTWA